MCVPLGVFRPKKSRDILEYEKRHRALFVQRLQDCCVFQRQPVSRIFFELVRIALTERLAGRPPYYAYGLIRRAVRQHCFNHLVGRNSQQVEAVGPDVRMIVAIGPESRGVCIGGGDGFVASEAKPLVKPAGPAEKAKNIHLYDDSSWNAPGRRREREAHPRRFEFGYLIRAEESQEPMKRVNQYFFYQIGAAVNPLVDLKDEVSYNDLWLMVVTAANSLRELLENEQFPVHTCRSAAQKLHAAAKAATPKIADGDDLSVELAKSVPTSIIWDLRNAAKEFELVFAAELETTDVYYVSQKGIYSTSDLIERADATFTAGVRAKLTPEIVSDIRQAGKALAFDLDTASGYHMIRATESLIHIYYVKVSGSIPRRKDRNWGAYVRNLNAHRKANSNSAVDPKLISLIDQVREHHRNPVMHPELTLSADEAQSLFNVCQGVIIAFAGALGKLP